MKPKQCDNGIWLKADTDIMGASQVWYSPPCKLKSCEECSKKRRVSIVVRIMSCVHNNPDMYWYFVTFTSRPKVHKTMTSEQSKKVLQSAWSRLRKRLNRRFKQLFWVKVWERHKSGIFHLHAIIGTNIPMSQRYIKENAFETGMGYQIKRIPLEGNNHVWYVAKYSTKTNVSGRAIDWSQNFPKIDAPTPESPLEWQYMGKVDIHAIMDYLYRLGIELTVLNDLTERDEE